MLDEIIVSFKETSSKEISLVCNDNRNDHSFQRTPELIYGLRNFIGNAVKFSKSKVEIVLISDNINIQIQINDDGPGFPEDIKENIGEPYIKSKSSQVSINSGTGLGTFLGKTLLERQSANLQFSKDKKLGGASVLIKWSVINLQPNV